MFETCKGCPHVELCQGEAEAREKELKEQFGENVRVIRLDPSELEDVLFLEILLLLASLRGQGQEQDKKKEQRQEAPVQV